MLTTLREFTSRIPAGFEAVKFRQRVNIGEKKKPGRITQGGHTREKAPRPLELTHYGMEIRRLRRQDVDRILHEPSKQAARCGEDGGIISTLTSMLTRSVLQRAMT